MPIPGAPGAPVFNGDRASDFLVLVEQLGNQAGITDKDHLVDWIVRYSTIDVRDTIQWLEQFDPEEDTKTWDEACETLKSLYASRDKAPQVTRKDLENFCKHTSETNVFTSSEDVDSYRIKYTKFAAPLVKNKKISKEERNYYFVTGLPNATLEWFHNQLPADKRYVNSAPEVDETVKIIKQRYNHNTIFYKPWTTSADKNKRVRFDLDGNRVDPSNDTDNSSQKAQKSPNSSVDDLAKQFNDMRINQASMNSALNELTRAIRQDNNPTLHSSQNQQPSYELQRRCFICGETNTHPLHPSRCHLMPGLLRDNLVIVNPNNQRYQLPTGNDLPKLPRDYEGGVAAFLRRQQAPNQQTSNAEFRRDAPPHINNASTSTIGLSYGGVDIFNSDVFAISAPDANDFNSYPGLRSGRDTSKRFDPKARPPRVDDQVQQTNDRGQTTRQRQPPIDTQPSQPVPGPSTQPVPNRQPPQVPTQKNIDVPQPKNPDVSMKDGTNKTGPSYHFTSTMSENTDIDKLYKKIIETEISIPVGQLIGASPALQKMVAESTRTKREYKTKSAEYSIDSDSYFETGREGETGTKISSNVCVGDFEELSSFLVHYSNAVMIQPEKFYAMVTGKMEVSINGVSLSAMIDSGSELNLMGEDVPERVGLPVDFEGMKWTLTGVNGGPERLRGVVTDVPMKLGKHEFPHHLFVANKPLENQDIILGQPFLHWFAARLDYWRTGVVKLYLWKDGDKTNRPTLSIVITDPTDKRNTTAIDRSSNEASIEYYEEDEDF
ncbi:hypothetical protein K435DRAFT_674857 [Dendrothele bispora CBS 962.96]|uniref:DUF4100 domain-containing protein n=1 Tax=Dendrothele bispora (strain CBS 962.96) TaxID=1314807 RepID=A0A4S8LQ28_DENBC|nr:hypothetical protein K435DRAFT_674857 [Dendrothele bispora CBS 962.96]